MFKIKTSYIIYIILFAIPNTLLSFGIVYIINNVIVGNKAFLTSYMGIVFFAVTVYAYLLNIIFQRKLNKFTFEVLCDNEKNIFYKILNTPLIKLEKLGSQRFYAAIEDTRLFYSVPGVVSSTISSLLMMFLCITYLFTLSIFSAFIVIAMIVLVAMSYFFVINTMSKKVAVVRKLNEDYFSYVNDVIKGFKELKISFQRRQNLLLKHLTTNRNMAAELDFNISFVFLAIGLISQYGLYFVIGAILFILPELHILKRADVSAYVVIILFIAGPINNLINLQDMFTRYVVANRRLKIFSDDFASDDLSDQHTQLGLAFESLEFKDIVFEHENLQLEKTFGLGPINISIKKGETVFIVGGNGSGKSTFINILSGLYKPFQGEIFLNEHQITSATDLQHLISVVFTDNHILSKNYEDYLLESNPEYQKLLKIMKLDEIVLDDSEESARRNFSKGQSKRMSLIFALLENKPILVLDEWAADQDPHFRKYFYETLLPKLKSEGKTIIAVTHDDAYFKQADRVIKFEYGRIIKNTLVAGSNDLESLWL